MHFSYKNTLKLCEVFYNIPDNNERKLSISCFANFLELFQINLIIKIPAIHSLKNHKFTLMSRKAS